MLLFRAQQYLLAGDAAASSPVRQNQANARRADKRENAKVKREKENNPAGCR